MAATQVNGGLEFGFVPRQVITDLQDVGNWKSRASAIDVLHRSLREVYDRSQILPNLPRFTTFLMALVADQNFKVAISSMAILGDLVVKLGRDIESQLRSIMPGLVEKFGDSKVLVRGANVAVLRKLMAAVAPRAVVEQLLSGLSHSSWRVREEVVNTLIVILLSYPRESLDMGRMLHALVDCLSDPKDLVQAASLEAMAVMNQRCGASEFAGMMQRSAMSEAHKSQVKRRLANPQLPKLGAQGELVAAVIDDASAQRSGLSRENGHSASLPVAGGKLPWDVPSPSRPQRMASTPTPPTENGGGYSLSQLGRKPRSELANGAQSSDNTPINSPSRATSDYQQQQQQMGQPPARREGSKLGQPQLYGSSPASTSGQNDGSSGGGRAGHHLQTPSALLSYAAPGVGGPQSAASFSAKNLPSYAAVRANEFGSHHDAPLSPSSRSGQSIFKSSHEPLSAASCSSDGGSLWPHFSGGAPASRTPSSHDHLSHLNPGTPIGRTASGTPAGGAGDQGLSLWLQGSMDSDDRNNPRMETYSPSKSEMLDKLKRRQQEKRVGTAQLSINPKHDPNGSPYASSTSSPVLLLQDDMPDCSPDSPACSKQWDETPVGGSRQRRMSSSYQDMPGSPAIGPPHGKVSSGPLGSVLNFMGGNGVHKHPVNSQYTEDSVPRAARPGNMSTGRLQRVSSAATPSTDPLDMANRQKPPRGGDHGGGGGGGGGGIGMRSFGSLSGDPPTLAGLSSLGGGGGGASLWGSDYKAASNLNELTSEQLTPVSDPEKCMRTTLATLVTANNAGRMDLDWQGQHEALNDARRLVRHHPDTVRAQLHEFVRIAIPAVDMLRSTTSKNALLLFQELFQSLGKSVDKELEEIVPTLLKKSGEVSTAGRENFLVGEADRTLGVMCRSCSEARCIAALAACAQHKSPTVRAKVASHLDNVVEASRGALQGGGAGVDRLFKVAAGFLDEGALEARTYGKRIIWHLKSALGKSEFDRLAFSITPAATQKKVMETVENCNGPPPPPSKGGVSAVARGGSRQLNATPSIESRDMVSLDKARHASTSAPVGRNLGRSNSRGSADGAEGRPAGTTPERRGQANGGSRSRTADVGDFPNSSASPTSLLNRSNSNKTRANGGEQLLGNTLEALNKALSQLSAKDVRERTDGLRALDSLVPSLGSASDSSIVAVLDGLGGRLSDGNSKVITQALETLCRLFAVLRDRSSSGLNTLVPALTSTLGSTNDKVRSVAGAATDALISYIDPALLIQNFSHCASNGHLRGKPVLVDKLMSIIKDLYPQRPQLVVKYAVPAALSLLNDTKGEVKASSSALLACLAHFMGDGLMDHAWGLTPALQQRVTDAIAGSRR